MIRVFTALCFLASLSAGAAHAWAAEVQTTGKRACSSGEGWSFSKSFSSDAAEQFRSFLGKKTVPSRGFADAVALRKSAHSAAEKLFSQYWMARVLLEMGDVHGAYAGFVVTAADRPDAETVGVLVGTLECLSQIRDRYSSLLVNGPSTERMDSNLMTYFDFTDRQSDLQSIWKFTVTEFRQALLGPGERLNVLVNVLQGSGIHESFARGLLAAANLDYKGTITYLPKVLSGMNSNAPGAESVARYSDQIHSLLARAYYADRHYAEATGELKKIEKNSNELAEGLSELAWSALMAGRYSEAIGAALNLQAGGLRRTFAPESPMVMAMALNEICQYPESLRAVAVFRTAYQPSYLWLNHWKSAPGEDLYAEAVQFLRRKRIPVPERVASEWVRSPVFISGQEELNLVVDEKQALKKSSSEAAREQKKMGQALRAQGKALRLEISLVTKGAFSPDLRKKLAAFRSDIDHYRNFRRAAGPFRKIANGFELQAPKLAERLKSSIVTDFSRKNQRMLDTLDEIAENNQLIEVEIYNGASGDIIWQNAHPDYKQLAAKIREDQIKVSANRVWNWGHAPALSDGWAEIWEDELGSFKSDLYDNCSSKEKYLAIKKLGFDYDNKHQASAGGLNK